MAKYTGTAGCGHSYEIQLYGATSERTRRLNWMDSAAGMCNACYAASKRAEEAKHAHATIQALAGKIVAQYGGIPSADVVAKARALIAANAGSDKGRQMAAALDLLGV